MASPPVQDSPDPENHGPLVQDHRLRPDEVKTTGEAVISERATLTALLEAAAGPCNEKESPRRRGRWRRMHRPLQTSARNGDEAAFELAMQQRSRLGITFYDVSDVTGTACERGDMGIIRKFLSHLESFGQFHDMKGIIEELLVEAWKGKQLQTIEYFLRIASAHCPPDELRRLTFSWRRKREIYNGGQIVSEARLAGDLFHACRAGNRHSIAIILESDQSRLLGARDLDKALLFAADTDFEDVVLSFVEALWPSHDDIVTASTGAGGADERILAAIRRLVAGNIERDTSQASLGQVMSLSCTRGHAQVVRYLLQRHKLNPNDLFPSKALATDDDDKSSMFTIATSTTWSRSPTVYSSRDSSTTVSIDPCEHMSSGPDIEEAIETPAALRDKSPLQSALRGFKSLSSKWCSLETTKGNKRWQKEVARLEQTVELLLESGADPNSLGGSKTYPIQMACMFASDRVVHYLIAKGADVNLRGKGRSTWVAAAGRERCSAAIMRHLLRAGAQLSTTKGNVETLFDKALQFFTVLKNNRYKDRVRELLKYESADTIFTKGPGALLYELLYRYKKRKAREPPYSTVLQLAAALNARNMVELLLFRRVNVNTRGQYYGTALQAAAHFGHGDLVETLLRAGADVDAISGRWSTALRAAVAAAKEGTVRILLAHGATIGLTDGSDGWSLRTMLQLAVHSRSSDTVKSCLEAGAILVSNSVDRPDPLFLSCHGGYFEITKMLLEAGAPVKAMWEGNNTHYQRRGTPLHAAAAGGYTDVVRMLLDHGASVSTSVAVSGTPLVEAARGNHVGVAKMLLDAGAKISDDNMPPSWNALSAACESGALPVVDLFLTSIGSVPHTESLGIEEALEVVVGRKDTEIFRRLQTRAPPSSALLIQACAVGSLDAVQDIIDSGVPVDVEDERFGCRPLEVAAWFSHLEIVRALLDRGARMHQKCRAVGDPKPMGKSKNNRSPGVHEWLTKLGGIVSIALMGCVVPHLQRSPEFEEHPILRRAHRLFVPKLPEKKQGLKMRQRNRARASLDLKLVWRCEDTVELLVNEGADINISGGLGHPLHLASFLGSRSLVSMFLDRGADVNSRGGYFETALHAAVWGGHPSVVSILLENGADPNARHPEQGTALHLACSKNAGDIAFLLLDHGADAKAAMSNGKTALTLALQEARNASRTMSFTLSPAFPTLAQFPDRLCVTGEDITIASKSQNNEYVKTLETVLALDKDFVVPESVILHLLGQRWFRATCTPLLLDRSAERTVTERMLMVALRRSTLYALMSYPRVCEITPQVLQAQTTDRAIGVLLDYDEKETIKVTEGAILHALEVTPGYLSGSKRQGVAERLWWRNPRLGVTPAMLKAAHHPKDLRFLLIRGKALRKCPLREIPADVTEAISQRPDSLARVLRKVMHRYGPGTKEPFDDSNVHISDLSSDESTGSTGSRKSKASKRTQSRGTILITEDLNPFESFTTSATDSDPEWIEFSSTDEEAAGHGNEDSDDTSS